MRNSARLLMTLAFIEGGSVMAVELLSARMLAPYYGAGVQVWGAVIGVTVGSLALGYYLGGKLSHKGGGRSALFLIFLLASVFMMIMPAEAKGLVAAFSGRTPLPAVLFSAVLLLTPCLSLFGAAPILIIQLLSKSPEDTGKAAGSVYAVSTLGGIFSTFLVGFYIIPVFGITSPTVILALIPGSVSFILLLISGKMMALAYLPVVLFGFLSTRSTTPRSNIHILYNTEGLLGQVLVADAALPGQSNRILFVNRMGQTFVDLQTGKSQWSYVKYITALCSTYPEKSKALLLGLGGGSLATNLVSLLGFELTAIELDERMGMLGKQFFGLPKQINPVVDDARHFIETTNDGYDLVVVDIFRGEILPSHILSRECFETIKKRLRPDGVLLINFNGFLDGKEGKAGRSLYNTLIAAGYHTAILPTFEPPKYRNCIFVCSNSTLKPGNPRLPLIQNGSVVDLSTLYLPADAVHYPNAQVYTDDMPRLEHDNIASARIWREEYNRQYTDLFMQKGVSLFK